MVRNRPANAGDIRDAGLILGSGRSPEGQPTSEFLPGKSQRQSNSAPTHTGAGNGALVSLGGGDTAQSSRRPSSQNSQRRVPDRRELCGDRDSQL